MPPQPPTTSIHINGLRMRETRVRAGITTEHLARYVGVTRAYVTKIELGHSPRVSPTVYLRIVSALGVKHDDLLADPVPAS